MRRTIVAFGMLAASATACGSGDDGVGSPAGTSGGGSGGVSTGGSSSGGSPSGGSSSGGSPSGGASGASTGGSAGSSSGGTSGAGAGGSSTGGSAGAGTGACAINPCKNGGICTNKAGGDFDCACTGTWAGKTCEEKCGKSALITYALTGRFKLSGTPMGTGDGEWQLPGTDVRTGGTPAVTDAILVLRVHADGVHASIVKFDIGHNLHQKKAVAETWTNLLHTSKQDACGVASGTISGTTLTWDTCTTPANYGTKSWVTSEVAAGPGCLAEAGSVGNVWCSGSCTTESLAAGDNAITRPPSWPQPLGKFTFAAADLKSFSSDYWFQPNDKKNAVAQMRIATAVETGRVVEVTPDCACPK